MHLILQIVRMVLSMCHKAIYNIVLRRKEEENKQIHIIEKKKQSDLVITALKEQGASEDQIEDMVKISFPTGYGFVRRCVL